MTSLKRHIRVLTREVEDLDQRIAELVAGSPELTHKAELMQSITGVGSKTAAACLAYIPELGTLTKGQAASIVGLAPHAKDSGAYHGHRHIGGGRQKVRATLYMSALTALRCNPALKTFAARLKARGKPSKVVIVAVMRKLIVILNAVLKSGRPAGSEVTP